MASRYRARQAQQLFQGTIERVVRCITGDGLFVRPGSSPSHGETQVLSFYTDRAQLAASGDRRLFLSLSHEYVIEGAATGEPRVSTLSYIYNIYDDPDGEPLLGYHYHPERGGDDPVPYPHLHVYGAPVTMADRHLPKLHLPTSRIALEDVVRLLIEGFGVEPRAGYADLDEQGQSRWRRELTVARERFLHLRRWA